MLPSVIEESLVCPFKYWNQGIQKGMRYGNQMYAHVKSYPLESRLNAYTKGCDLAEQGKVVCVTVSKMGYSVWVNLRSDDAVKSVPELPSFSKTLDEAFFTRQVMALSI